MKILFCGGGTAGHITPAIAIAQTALAKGNNTVVFVGRRGGEENKLIRAEGYKLYEIDVRGFARSLSFSNFKNLKLLYSALKYCKNILKTESPDVVVGTGGYVSFPVIFAASRLKIPTVIHESNATVGVATRLLSRRVSRLLLGMDISDGALAKRKNATYVGTPIRKEFRAVNKVFAKRKIGIKPDCKLILSVGGSIGSEKMNDVILEFMENTLSDKSFSHVHICGARFYEDVKSKHGALCKSAGSRRVIPFAKDIPTYLSAADLVITRCGAITLSEISYLGVPSILIPSPNVTADHQRKNALCYIKNGGTVLLEEQQLSSERLKEEIYGIINSEEKLAEMRACAEKNRICDSDEKIYNVLLELL